MTIRQIDIARKVGISRIAVSKALRDHPDISTQMKAKVRKVADELGYIPNLTARNLQAQKTFTIGVVVPDISNSFFSFAIHGIMDAAAKHDYQIILSASRENAAVEKKNIMTFLAMRVDGLLVAVSKDTSNMDIFEKVKKTGTPLVFFDRSMPDAGFSSVGIDDYESARTLINYLIQNGHSKIAHLAGNYTTDIGRARFQGFQDAMHSAGIGIENEWIVECGFSRSGGYDGAKKILAASKLPEVIFAVNDRTAQGAYKAIREAGLSIPKDIGIVAFGHSEFADLLYPPLTIIDSPPNLLGQQALQLLLTEIDDLQQSKQKIVLDTKLTINESVKQGKKVQTL
jgi:LacI family transcriptional regulator